MSNTTAAPAYTYAEQSMAKIGSKLNWLRAGVLGANDGIVSVAGLLTGVAAAGAGSRELLTAGTAAVISGAVSMALGEYVSVSAQRDTEKALVERQRWELANRPEAEHEELVRILMRKGVERPTAEAAAEQMRSYDELGAHLELELGIEEGEYTNPWVAAAASAVAFVAGAIIPMLVVLIVPEGARVISVLLAALFTLSITGTVSALFSEGSHTRSVARLVIGGALAFEVTYVLGMVLGTSVAG